MMGYYGDGFGWMWLWGLLLLIGIGVLVLLAVRLFTGETSRGGPANYGPALRRPRPSTARRAGRGPGAGRQEPGAPDPR